MLLPSRDKVPYLARRENGTLRNWLRQKGQCWWPWLRNPCFGFSSTQNTGSTPLVGAGKSVQSGQTITWHTGANRLCLRWANDRNKWVFFFFSFLKSGQLTWTENINQLAHLVDLFQVYVIDVIRTDESGSQQRAQYLLAEYESLQLMEESNSIQQRKAAN